MPDNETLASTPDLNTTVNLFDLFETDSGKELDGKWFNYGPDETKDPGFRCRRAGGENSAYDRAFALKIKEHAAFIQANKKNPSKEAIELVHNAAVEAMIETVLVTWRNVRSKERGLIPYSPEEARALFKKLPELFADLRDKCLDMSNFKADENAEVQIKN
jgi:hypothetical protein